VAAALVGGYFLYSQIQNQLSGSKTVAVGNYLGIREADAVAKILAIGLRPNPVRQPNADPAFPETYVFQQSPRPGDRTPKNNFVTIYVSLGPPKTDVPSVVGEPLDKALSDLQNANLKGKAIPTDSTKPQGQVISQSPTAGASVQQGSLVKLKVSKGPKPVAVPNVLGSTFDSANSTLLGSGFAVLRKDVKSDSPKDTVVDTSPGPGTLQPPGTTITVMVSKGPTTSTVPDVTTLSQNDAQATLKASGFGVKIVSQPVTDQSQDGIVQTQDPQGGTQQPPGTTVTIAVGKFSTSSGPPP
jgi:serine/threonine-protein kinase